MGAVDTTYTFTATDTITSTKMNNIIDQTTMTGDAIIGNTLEVASGKLKVRSLGITSNEIADSNVITVKIADANVTQAKLAANVVGNGPLFRVYASTAQSIPSSSTPSKVTLDTEEFDTNSNFSSSRFTPTVAGHYLIEGAVAFANAFQMSVRIYKNGSVMLSSDLVSANASMRNVSGIVYLNGSTDFVELYVEQTSGTSRNTLPGSTFVYMSGCLIRSA